MELGKKYDAAANAVIEENAEKAMNVTELHAHATEICEMANIAILKKDSNYAAIMHDLGKAVDAFNDLSMREVFKKCRDAENPRLEAAKIRVYDAIRARVINDTVTKAPKKVEIVDHDGKIDLIRFCEFCGLPTTWWTTVEAYTQFLALQKSKNLGVSDERQQYLIEKFKVSEDAKKVDMTKFSNGDRVRALQAVIDEMVFVQGKTEGVNALRVNNHDIEYIDACVTREGKGVCEVKFSDSKALRRILFNVCHRLAVNGVYTLGYKEIRPKQVPVAEVVPGTEKTVVPASDGAVEPEKVSASESNVTRVRKPRKKKAAAVETPVTESVEPKAE